MIFIVLVAFPVVWICYLFYQYALNVPHWDDHALKYFILNFEKTTSFNDKIKLLFAQHNEHRIVLTRLFALLVVFLKGNLDFKWLMFLGNLSLFGILVIFYKILIINKKPIISAIPLVWLLLTASLYEIFFWGMTSVQNFWVIFLALFSFYHLSYKSSKYSFLLALVTSLLALLTSGNGLLVGIIGFVILGLIKEYKLLFLWMIFNGILIFYYFFFYTQRPDSAASLHEFSLMAFMKNTIVFLGVALDSFWILPFLRVKIAIAAAIVLFTFFVVVAFKLLNKNKLVNENQNFLFLFSSTLFILGTAAIIVLSRLNYGTDILFTSKYKIYSTLFAMLLCCYFLVIQSTKTYKLTLLISMIFGILIWLNFYLIDYRNVIYTYQERIADLINWKLEAKNKGQQISNYPYQMPLSLLDNFPTNFMKDSTIIDSINEQKDYIDFVDSNFVSQNASYLLLKNNQEEFIVPTFAKVNPSKKTILKNYFVNGFTASFSKINRVSGKYQIFLIQSEENSLRMFNTGKVIDIEGVIQKEKPKNW